MITKVKIIKAVLTDKNKDGTPCMAAGKPVKRMGIQTAEYENQWLSCTIWRPGQKEESLKDGQEVEISIVERAGFKNFTLASKTDKMQEEIDAVKVRIARLEQLAIYTPKTAVAQKEEKPDDLRYPDDIDPASIPF